MSEQTTPAIDEIAPASSTTSTSTTSTPSFDFAAAIEAGFVFVKAAAQNGWNVTGPDGRHGFGATPADAALNIGAQIIPDASTGRRVLHRENGESVLLDTVVEVIDEAIDAAAAVAKDAVETLEQTIEQTLEQTIEQTLEQTNAAED